MTAPASQTARAQLRQAVLAALACQPGINIASPGVWDVQPVNMPAVRVRASSDTKRGKGKAPPNFVTNVSIDVQLYVEMPSQEDAQDAAEVLSDALENAILTNVDLIALVNAFNNVASQVHIVTTGDTPYARVDMTLDLECNEFFVDPGPYFILQELNLFLDAKGGPVDPTGVYSNGTPFLNEATDPPRNPVDGGPDGRIEGQILLDMTTGLPPTGGGITYPPRAKIYGNVVQFPDGRTLDHMTGWSFGRWGVVLEEDFDLIKAQGAGIVRIPLRWNGLYGSDADSRDMSQPATAFIDPGHLATVDQQIQWAIDRGIWWHLFIDSNCGQNGAQTEDDRIYCQLGDPDSMWPDGRNFITDPVMFEQFRNVWRFAAAKWGTRPFCAMFELLPEPSFPNPHVPAIQNLYRTLAADVRPLAPGVPFLVGPWQYKATNIKDAWDPTQPDFIYTGDLFAHENATDVLLDFQQRLALVLQLRQKQGVPVWIQQVGVNSSSGGDNSNHDWLRGCLNMLTTGDANGPVGAEYWELRDPAANSDPGGYGAIWTSKMTGLDVIKTSYMAVIETWISGQLA